MTPFAVAQILAEISGAFGGRWDNRADVWVKYSQGVSDEAGHAACSQWIERNRTGPTLGGFLDSARLIQRRSSTPATVSGCPECSGLGFHRVLVERIGSDQRWSAQQPCRCNPLDARQTIQTRMIRRLPEPYMPGSPEFARFHNQIEEKPCSTT